MLCNSSTVSMTWDHTNKQFPKIKYIPFREENISFVAWIPQKRAITRPNVWRQPGGKAVSKVRAPKQPHEPRVQVTCSLETVGKALKYNTPLSILLITKTARKFCNVGTAALNGCLLAQADEGNRTHRVTNCGVSAQERIPLICQYVWHGASRQYHTRKAKINPFSNFRILWPCITKVGWREGTNKMQLIRCLLSNFYLNMFRASLCPSSGDQDRVVPDMVFCTVTKTARCESRSVFVWSNE